MVVVNFKRIIITLLLSVLMLAGEAQQSRFVYLQTESGQPFYVKLNNNKVISSSPAGYLILPNLVDGDYKLVVGFPKNESPEEVFNVTIDKKNAGFLLKDFGEKGKSLFNLQTLALVPGTNASSIAANPPKANPVTDTTSKVNAADTAKPAPQEVRNDAFSTMLATVVKDSSILQKTEPEVVPAETPTPKNETAAVVDTPVAKVNEVAQETNTPADSNHQAVANSSITKLMGEKDNDGMQMIYLDKSANDTVRVFIPADKTQPQAEEKAVVQDLNNPPKDSEAAAHEDSFQLTITPTIVKPAEREDTVTLINDTIRVYKESASNNVNTMPAVDSANKKQPLITVIKEQAPESKKPEKKNAQNVTEDQIIVLPKVVTSSKVNSDCKGFATNEDFLRLRKKMAAESSNDDMIQAAKKIFRTKCFSTEQIRNLSYLFLTDEGKYMFFDAAYAFTSDSDQYEQLQSQLKDEYYINRFNAMIHVK